MEPRPFDLMETMRFDPLDGVADLERHLARLKDSAAALGFVFDRHEVRNELHAAAFRRLTPARLRLRLARGGAVAIELTDLPPPPAGPVAVAVVPLPLDPDDPRLRHKTSDRAHYDRARAASGRWEVLFADGAGRLTEGSFTNLFVDGGDGRLLTPPAALPLRPGVLRERLLAEGAAEEAELRVADLRRPFHVGNALRGLVAARLG